MSELTFASNVMQRHMPDSIDLIAAASFHMVQAGVAPYPGAPTGYPPTTAQVGAATDALSMAVVKADPVTAQMKADAAAVATNGATNTNVTSSAATTAAVAQLYMQQKKIGRIDFKKTAQRDTLREEIQSDTISAILGEFLRSLME
uniref:Uncharacterized protein n=1 Tax=Glossina pallidipes TaxID=7398 RepID=A0A1B0ADG1_GLOPL